MAMQLRWVGLEERERVAGVRLRSFGTADKDWEKYRDGILIDHGTTPTEFLLAELDGEAVGTVTPSQLWMWVRGNRIACQGVAYVGTIRTHRRGGGGEKGIASKLMWETLRQAREREQVATALMPFRASYYERFGYGVIERRMDWTIPLAVMPSVDFTGIRFYREGDLAAMAACRQRMVEAGQCDIERTAAMWQFYQAKARDGMTVVDRPADGGDIRGWMTLLHESENGKTQVRVADWGHDSPEALARQLSFLGSLKDQYASAAVTVQADVPINWLLKETQLPHRPVNHATAIGRPFTRMQLRVLNHQKMIEGMKLQPGIRGGVVVAIKESGGHTSKFRIDLEGGRATVNPTDSTAEVECPDRVWAAVVCGDLAASKALKYGLLSGDPERVKTLDAFAAGTAPYCLEYF